MVRAIALNTFREVIRDQALAGVLGFGFTLLLFTRLLSPLVLGEGLRLTVDLGLSSLSVFGMLVIVMVGTSLVAKEIDRRTIYNLLARPVPRPAYLLGKWCGLVAALWTVVWALGAGLLVLLALCGGGRQLLATSTGIYMAGLELSVMASLAVLFSALSTPVLSALYTLGFYCGGQWSYDLRAFAEHFPAGLASVTETVASLMPSLPLFNVRGHAVAGSLPSALHLGVATTYAALYVAGALGLAAVCFESRDFK